MSEHTAFLRLAATAVDFQLEPADGVALAQHLQGCGACRRASESLRTDAANLRSLPRRSPSPHIAAVVVRAARGEARTGRSPLVLGLGFLLLAGLAGAVVGGTAIIRSLESDDPTVPPSAVPTDAAIVAPTAEPRSPEPSRDIDPRLGVEWQVVTLENDGRTATSANAVTATGSDFVAVGRTCRQDPGGDPQCWGGVQLSSDGLTWESVARQPGLEIGAYYPTSGPGADMIGVAAGSDAIVAIGYAIDGAMTLEQGGTFGPAVWVSTDGRTWHRTPDGGVFEGARFSDVVATADGYVIVGALYDAQYKGQPRGAIWTSDDGRAWRRVPDGSVFDIGGYQVTGEDPGSGGPQRAIAARDMILSVGAVCNDEGLDCVAAFWSSPDGSSWDRMTLDEPNVVALDVVATADGFVAVGTAGNTAGCGVGLPCTAAVLTSSDGRTWQRTQVDVPEGMIAPDGFSDAVVVGARIIATAEYVEGQGGDLRWLWWSIDGRVWNPVEAIPDDLRPGPMAAGPDRAVIVPVAGGDIRSRFLISPPP